eukprot:6209879-Pleurochrysis_carterae.AAC.1
MCAQEGAGNVGVNKAPGVRLTVELCCVRVTGGIRLGAGFTPSEMAQGKRGRRVGGDVGQVA